MQTLLIEKDVQAALEEIKKKAKPLAAYIDEKDLIPPEIRNLLWEEGFLNLFSLSNGKVLQSARVCKIVEELSKISASLGLLVIVQAVGTLPILLAGNPAQKNFFSREIASKKYLAFALTEPKSGSDAQSIQTCAEKIGSKYVLNGSKIFVTNGEMAHHFVIFAKINQNHKHSTITAFVVDRKTKGLEVGPKSNLTGMRGVPATFLTFRNVKVSEENRLGEDGEGFKIAMKTFDISRPFIGAQAVGIAEGAMRAALQFARKRILFGQPITHQQGIQFMLADMATGIEAARSLVYRAAHAVDNADKRATRYSSMAKYFASDMAVKVTTDAFQVFGGYGCLKGSPVERMIRDAKITQIFEGTNQIQRMIVGRSILKDDGK